MSGEDVNVNAGVAEAKAEAGEPDTDLQAGLRGRGPKVVGARVPGKGGRRSERDVRLAAIVDAINELGGSATREEVAASRGRVTKWGELQTDFKDDVRAAGGWHKVLLQAEQARKAGE